MPYYSCPECALIVESVAGRFTRTICPRCSSPLEGAAQVYSPEREPVAIRRRFAAEPRAAGAARRALEAPLLDLDPAQFQVAALLTTELIANAIDHSRTGTCGSVRLEIVLTDERLRVEVGDDGPGFVPAPRSADAPLDSHWGLHLVEELADRWGVVAEPETLVWFELYTWLSPEVVHRSQPSHQNVSA